MTILKLGDKGSEVRELQRTLRDLGYDIKPDGDFGPKTRAAVMRFQYMLWGLSEDVNGIVGPATWEWLEADLTRFRRTRDEVMDAAARHLGKPYYWGGAGPDFFDCSGLVLYVLQEELGLIDWGDDTAHGIMKRLPETKEPIAGDLVLFLNSRGKATHIEFFIDDELSLGASGGGSNTFGKDPKAYVKIRDFTKDSRRVMFCSIDTLLNGD